MKRPPESNDFTTSFAPYDSTTAYSEFDIPNLSASAIYSGQQIPQGDQNVQGTTSATRSQEFTDNSHLEFAPYITAETSQFD